MTSSTSPTLVASDAEFQPRWPNWLSGLVASIAVAQLVGYLLAIVAAVLLPGGHPPAFAVILIFLFYAAAALALPAILVGLATIWARRGKVWSRRRLMFISTMVNAVCILVAATLIMVFFPWLPGQLIHALRYSVKCSVSGSELSCRCAVRVRFAASGQRNRRSHYYG